MPAPAVLPLLVTLPPALLLGDAALDLVTASGGLLDVASAGVRAVVGAGALAGAAPLLRRLGGTEQPRAAWTPAEETAPAAAGAEPDEAASVETEQVSTMAVEAPAPQPAMAVAVPAAHPLDAFDSLDALLGRDVAAANVPDPVAPAPAPAGSLFDEWLGETSPAVEPATPTVPEPAVPEHEAVPEYEAVVEHEAVPHEAVAGHEGSALDGPPAEDAPPLRRRRWRDRPLTTTASWSSPFPGVTDDAA